MSHTSRRTNPTIHDFTPLIQGRPPNAWWNTVPHREVRTAMTRHQPVFIFSGQIQGRSTIGQNIHVFFWIASNIFVLEILFNDKKLCDLFLDKRRPGFCENSPGPQGWIALSVKVSGTLHGPGNNRLRVDLLREVVHEVGEGDQGDLFCLPDKNLDVQALVALDIGSDAVKPYIIPVEQTVRQQENEDPSVEGPVFDEFSVLVVRLDNNGVQEGGLPPRMPEADGDFIDALERFCVGNDNLSPIGVDKRLVPSDVHPEFVIMEAGGFAAGQIHGFFGGSVLCDEKNVGAGFFGPGYGRLNERERKGQSDCQGKDCDMADL